jgi:hypothetical protein
MAVKQFWATGTIILAFISSPADGQTEPIKQIDVRFEPAEARPGQTVTMKLDVKLNDGWRTYPSFQPDLVCHYCRNLFVMPLPGDVVFVERIKDPANFKVRKDDIEECRYYDGGASWEFKAVVSPTAAPGIKKVALQKCVMLLVTRDFAVPPRKVTIAAELKVLDAPALAIEPKFKTAFLFKAVAGFVAGNTVPLSFAPK